LGFRVVQRFCVLELLLLLGNFQMTREQRVLTILVRGISNLIGLIYMQSRRGNQKTIGRSETVFLTHWWVGISDDLGAPKQGGTRPPPPGPPGYVDPGAMSSSWMDGVGSSPYYGASAGRPGAAPPPPYPRPHGQQPYGDPAIAASMYRQHSVLAYSYGPPPPGAPGSADRYGYAPAHHQDMYMRHHYPPPHGISSSSSKSSPPNPALADLTGTSAVQLSAKTPSKSSPGSNREGDTPLSKGENDPKTPNTHSSFSGSTGSPKSSSKRASSAKSKKKKGAHEVTELEDLHIDKRYSGSISLGLEDDKY
jgi:hypothetical protein